jgi:parallel beta-helix repeat protein
MTNAFEGSDMKNIVAMLTWTVLLVPLSAQAAELWVDRDSLGGTCSDGRSREDVSETTPWCTLGAAGSGVEPGDVVRVRAGVYTEVQTCGICNDNSVLQVVVSGTEGSPIRFQAEAGEEVVVTGDGGATHGIQLIETYDDSVQPHFVEVVGFVVRDVPSNCVAVTDTGDILLLGLEVSGCGGGAIELHRTSNVTVESCLVHDNPMDGWTSAIDLYLCHAGNVVRGNFIWANTDEDPRDTEGHGLTMDTCGAGGGALIENNVIWDNEGWCMAIYESDGGVIRNNTCWNNGRRDEAGEITILGEHHAVHNNILVPRDGMLALNIRERSDYPVDYSTIEADHNILWAPTHDVVAGWADGSRGTVAEYRASNPGGWGTQTLQDDPLLVDTGAAEFSVAEGSPAIDSGDDANAAARDVLGAERPFDGDGDSAAVSDRGAYEYLSPPDPDYEPEIGVEPSPDPAPDASTDATTDPGSDPGDGSEDSGCGCAIVG